MSVVYEPRQFHHGDTYPAITDLDDHDAGDPTDVRFSDHDVNVTDLTSYNPPAPGSFPSPEPHHLPEIAPAPATPQAPVTLPTPKDDHHELPTPQRSKPIPKPDRDVKKNAQGKFLCTYPACTEEVREFNRKCEWSKHMDKHDRPYKCPADGCEKLPGFTYSGGLLRHEREVHGKHGGPKNPLNCPHHMCKRHTGKGFSRQENLNEHLRRVHTNGNNSLLGPLDDGTLDDALVVNVSVTDSPPPPVIIGEKRKAEDDDDLRSEVKRLHQVNESLSQQLEAQKRQSVAMMAEIQNMQATINELHQQQRAVQEQTRLPSVPPLDGTTSPF
ncbi:hypothetical protein BX600DRAFT_459047 [Xylariales sp. PMI_506]|nr:hypothetical protein BX600DRAFT_459047 [Xylariales sp. PMI_506]